MCIRICGYMSMALYAVQIRALIVVWLHKCIPYCIKKFIFYSCSTFSDIHLITVITYIKHYYGIAFSFNSSFFSVKPKNKNIAYIPHIPVKSISIQCFTEQKMEKIYMCLPLLLQNNFFFLQALQLAL